MMRTVVPTCQVPLTVSPSTISVHCVAHHRRNHGPAGGGTDPQFDYCYEANDAGYGPYYQGQDPEYEWYDDADSDGIVCEPSRSPGPRLSSTASSGRLDDTGLSAL